MLDLHMIRELAIGADSRYKRKVIQLPTPAPGADTSIAVPGGKLWVPLAFNVTFTTSVAVANRSVQLMFLDSTHFGPYLFQPSYGMTASQTNTKWFIAGLGYINPLTIDGDDVVGIPYVPLPGGWQVGTRTINIQAADVMQFVIMDLLEVDMGGVGEWETHPGPYEWIQTDPPVSEPYVQPFNR